MVTQGAPRMLLLTETSLRISTEGGMFPPTEFADAVHHTVPTMRSSDSKIALSALPRCSSSMHRCIAVAPCWLTQAQRDEGCLCRLLSLRPKHSCTSLNSQAHGFAAGQLDGSLHMRRRGCSACAADLVSRLLMRQPWTAVGGTIGDGDGIGIDAAAGGGGNDGFGRTTCGAGRAVDRGVGAALGPGRACGGAACLVGRKAGERWGLGAGRGFGLSTADDTSGSWRSKAQDRSLRQQSCLSLRRMQSQRRKINRPFVMQKQPPLTLSGIAGARGCLNAPHAL